MQHEKELVHTVLRGRKQLFVLESLERTQDLLLTKRDFVSCSHFNLYSEVWTKNLTRFLEPGCILSKWNRFYKTGYYKGWLMAHWCLEQRCTGVKTQKPCCNNGLLLLQRCCLLFVLVCRMGFQGKDTEFLKAQGF